MYIWFSAIRRSKRKLLLDSYSKYIYIYIHIDTAYIILHHCHRTICWSTSNTTKSFMWNRLQKGRLERSSSKLYQAWQKDLVERCPLTRRRSRTPHRVDPEVCAVWALRVPGVQSIWTRRSTVDGQNPLRPSQFDPPASMSAPKQVQVLGIFRMRVEDVEAEAWDLPKQGPGPSVSWTSCRGRVRAFEMKVCTHLQDHLQLTWKLL